MSERSCPVSGSALGRCPAGTRRESIGPRGCAFSEFTQHGDIRAALNIPNGVDVESWLRLRERKALNEILYSNTPSVKELNATVDNKNIDTLPAKEQDLLAAALGAPARQVILRAEEVGPATGWRDGFLTTEYGFVPPDLDEYASALASSPGRVWSDLAERMPGCVSRGRARESIAALPLVEGTEEVIPDSALWAAIVVLGLLCSIYRYEEKHDGHEGVSLGSKPKKINVDISDDILEEVKGIPKSIGRPYSQISRRMGRPIPHLTFVDQSSYNIKVRDSKSAKPYLHRFDNIDLRWPMFGDKSEIAFLKGCADTSASFQHGPDAIAKCQEHVMNRNIEGLLREMVRLKEILEQMPNAFHSISPNPNSGDNYVSADEWVRWAKMSAPLSKRCPASSGLQFPPYLLMDAFLGRKKYDSFLGKEGVHLRAWAPTNLRAFIAAIEYHYSIPEFCIKSGDARLLGVLDGIIEAYAGERGFMGVHRYKVFGILEVAAKTGRSETNGNSGKVGVKLRPWEETHQEFSAAMKERLEPYRGNIPVEPHEMRGTFEECRYATRILSRSFIDEDPTRSTAMVTLDLQDTGITFQPGDRLAIMPLNGWEECAKVALALGLEDTLDANVDLNPKWKRFAEHIGSVSRTPVPSLAVRDIIRRGHLAPLTEELVLKVHNMLRASSNVVLQVLATDEWPVRGSLGDLLQAAVADTPSQVWDKAFDLSGTMSWLSELITIEVPRTYSISNYPDELLPSTVDLTVSRASYELCATFSGSISSTRTGVSSGFLNPVVSSVDDTVPIEEEILIGVSRPVSFQLPLDGAAPCVFFAGGSGIAPFRSFWQARVGQTVGRNILYLGVQSRAKFSYERELRAYVNAGAMEVHIAFSRDSRGLVHDPSVGDLVEKTITPRYIDTLIVEQGETICEMVMSKKQGGLGGSLYICGSVLVFDSVMSGIRKAIYNHRTATMESTDLIMDAAFAERRIMLDVFMTPKPLPCNLPTIPQSQLALHTGHRPNTRMWIGVHGKVYDVTDFCPMHPGGTLIIKSNAGVDCSKSFDNLAHTTNPEVTSLLTKYFVGHLTAKPDFHGVDDLSSLYDLWLDYLRTIVETVVAQQFEMNKIMGITMGTSMDSTNLWFHGGMLNIKGVRSYYQYQSRLLQGGFTALFGPKFQELVLKLSFALANSTPMGESERFPDILGVIARAKSSDNAVITSQQIATIGDVIRDSNSARFNERGIIAYASKSVELDMALLEDIRQEACNGMDAFESISDLEIDLESQGFDTLANFLMQTLERMAKRLEIFYSRLAQFNIYQPEIERNPARTRWFILRQRIRDGSFFLLTQNTVLGSAPTYMPPSAQDARVDFDNVFAHIKETLANAPPKPTAGANVANNLNTMNAVRTQTPKNGMSAFESHENGKAIDGISSFINKNMRAIRRLSKLPSIPANFDISSAFHAAKLSGGEVTRASSRTSNPSVGYIPEQSSSELYNQSHLASRLTPDEMHGELVRLGMGLSHQPARATQLPPTPPLDATAAINSIMSNPNMRSRSKRVGSTASAWSVPAMSLGNEQADIFDVQQLRNPKTLSAIQAGQIPRISMNGALRSFQLSHRVSQRQQKLKLAPTF